MRTRIRVALASLFLAGAANVAPAQEEEREHDVRLMVVVVVDQMIPEQLERLPPWFQGGLGRFTDEGEVWRRAAHGHGLTNTGPGHATIGTGVFPNRHGVVSNDWPKLEEKGGVYCAFDPAARLVTGTGIAEQGGSRSASQMQTLGFAGHLKALDGQSRCVSIAGKDRAAALTLGPTPAAGATNGADWCLWWSKRGEGFVTSTHYASALPPSVLAWNTRWRESVAGASSPFDWTDSLPEGIERAGTAIDDRPGEHDLLGRRLFPHPAPAFSTPPTPMELAVLANWIYHTPWVDRYVAELAGIAVRELELGADEHIDFLFVGLSSADTAGHLFGPYSREITDIMLRADRELGALFALLDEEVGANHWIAALTADHGVHDLPERAHEAGIPARRISGDVEKDAYAAMRAALVERYGDDFYVGHLVGPRFSRERMTAAGVDPAEVRKLAAEVWAREGAAVIERVFTLDELLAANGVAPDDPLLAAMSRSTYLDRSPDLVAVRRPGLLRNATGTTHGTPWWPDRRAPLAFIGPGTTAGKRFEPCSTVDLLPTLFDRAGLAVPENLDGEVLR